MSKKILVTGANGQLGRSILKFVPDYNELDFTFVTRKELDLSRTESIDDYFRDKEFDVVINCAAYTAVDKAEEEPELANQVNHLAVKQLAQICKKNDISLIHISTDYVFDGQNYKPYIETDDTNPKNIYGKTKLAGERALQEINPNGIIIRTSWVYSEFGDNFVKTMLRIGKERKSLNVIFDQVGTPTYAGDLAETILNIITHSKFKKQEVRSNVYHYSNEGVASWYDFAIAIFELRNIECEVIAIETKDYPTAAERPQYSLLNKRKIKNNFKLKIPYWKDSLVVTMRALKSNIENGR